MNVSALSSSTTTANSLIILEPCFAQNYTLCRKFALLHCYFSLRVLCLLFHCISLSLPPPLRYYVAEGVRLYSQETWRVVTQTRGVQLVEQHIDKVVSG